MGYNKYIMIMAGVMLLTGCSSSDGDEPRPSETSSPYVMIGSGYNTDQLTWSPISGSRAEGDGLTSVVPESIGVWSANTDGSTEETVFDNQQVFYLYGTAIQSQSWYTGTFQWADGNEWPYNPLKEWEADRDYKFVAYAPYSPTASNDVTINDLSYSDMQTLTYRHVAQCTEIDYLYSSTIVTYASKDKENTVQTLLMKHFGSRLRFCFKLGAPYSNLRYIHLKDMQIENPAGALYTVTVDYLYDAATASYTPSVTWIPEDDPETTTSHQLTKEIADDYLLLSKDKTTFQPFASCYVYPGEKLETITITVTYDIYDTSDQLLRQNDTATCTLFLNLAPTGSLSSKELLAGNYYDVYVNVMPSYLYVLSDNDPNSDGGIVINPSL
ncbi:MAG: fimbrillin family protein [Bacteroidales bacterium]|nr:fimbrillin family protein [Bacteroidales bacterium]